MVTGNLRQFQESITLELEIIKDRVRNLIGQAHWGEEGRYKEAILKNVLKKYLPNHLSVATGFILDKGSDFSNGDISTQIDILVYDNRLPILFSEGDFAITTPQNVKAIIEVKTSSNNSNLKDIIKKIEENKKFFNNGQSLFVGIFCFEFSQDLGSDLVYKNATGFLNHLSLGKSIFVKFWNRHQLKNLWMLENVETDIYNFYKIKNLSFSYFISNLIHTVVENIDDRSWFSFPIEGGKEQDRIRTIYLDKLKQKDKSYEK